MAEEAKKDRLPRGRKKRPERESGNERSTVDGYPKRQTERAELCGAGPEVPHGPTNSKAVRGIAAEAGVHIERTEAHEDGPVQADRGRVAGGGAVFGAADPGEAAGNGI